MYIHVYIYIYIYIYFYSPAASCPRFSFFEFIIVVRSTDIPRVVLALLQDLFHTLDGMGLAENWRGHDRSRYIYMNTL